MPSYLFDLSLNPFGCFRDVHLLPSSGSGFYFLVSLQQGVEHGYFFDEQVFCSVALAGLVLEEL